MILLLPLWQNQVEKDQSPSNIYLRTEELWVSDAFLISFLITPLKLQSFTSLTYRPIKACIKIVHNINSNDPFHWKLSQLGSSTSSQENLVEL